MAWPAHLGLDLTVMNEVVDPTFRFLTVDWDGRIRMDPSSSWAMQGLIGLKDRFHIALACDTDHDRHGIVTRGAGCCRRTTIFRWPFFICSSSARSGARRRWARRWSAAR